MSNDRASERAFLVQDLCVVLVSVFAARVAREALAAALPGLLLPLVPLRYQVLLLVAFLPAWALSARWLGLERIRTLSGAPISLLRALLWTQAAGCIALALILVSSQVEMNRSFLALFLALSTLMLACTKLGQRRWILRTSRQSTTLVLGPAERTPSEDLVRSRASRVERLHSTDPEDLQRRLRAGGVDEVFVPMNLPVPRQKTLLAVCETIGVPAFVPLEEVDLELVPPRSEVVGKTLYIAYRPLDRDQPGLVLKGILDVLLGVAALLVLSPLMLVVAILIRMTSPGPALFVQERGGLHGRPFPMLKFRTMRQGGEAEREALLAENEMAGPVFKMTHDPRVTPIGRFLRRSSIDELPQLINVLLGHMSMVGPRPLPVVETRELGGLHRRRLSMKPGITGLWQVSGRNQVGFEEWMKLDLAYIHSWSLGLDLWILLKTLPAVVTGRGAR